MQFDNLEEHRGPIDLHVQGTIPAWAAGSLYRTGPGQSSVKDTPKGTYNVTHWFDGFAQTHRFDISASDSPYGQTTVSYSSRRQSEEFVNHIKQKGWHTAITFAQKADPCVGMFSKFMSHFQPQLSNHNVTVQVNVPGLPAKNPAPIGHRTGVDNVFIGLDNSALQRVDSKTLEPLGLAVQTALHPALKGEMSCAHAQRDPETGDYFNYNLQFGRLATYRIFRVNAATGTTDILATVSEAELPPAYMHSFFLTQNYVVLCVQSAHFMWKGLKIVQGRNLVDAIEPFDKARACRWIVVDRRHNKGVVGRFSTPAGFFFHTINAFEERIKDEKDIERTDICLDYVAYENQDVMRGLYYDVILDRNDAAKKYWFEGERHKTGQHRMVRYRYRIPKDGSRPKPGDYKSLAEETLSIRCPHAGDLPTINPSYACKPYRFFYSAANRGLSTIMDALAKTDLHTGTALIWSGPRGHTPGEPIFVPRPGATEEDDGVVLSVVVDGTAEDSYLLCLDARTMEEVGRAEVGFAIGAGFHGTHVPAV